MKKIKLNKTVVDRIKFEGKELMPGKFTRHIVWDVELPGFGLRIFPSGLKAFVLSYRKAGRKRLMTLGQYGVLTAEQARNQARLTLGQILSGEDPLEIRQRESSAKTVKALCEYFLQNHSKAHKKSWVEDRRRMQTYITPAIGSLRLHSVTYEELYSLHQRIGLHSICEANKVVSLLGTIFEKGRLWGFMDRALPNPARGIPKFKERSRDRWVTPDELPRLAKAINEEQNEFARYALWLYLLTGVRKSELLKAKWADVDFQRRELRLIDTKAGNDHYVPLSTPALTVLNQIPRTSNNPYIIQGRRLGRPLVNITKPWNRVKTSAGVTDVRLHDLRRTVGSWMAQSGNSLHLIGRVLNHANASTTQVYARFGQDNVRAALEEHGGKVMDLTRTQPKLGSRSD